MTDIVLFVTYFLSSCSGQILMKYGSMVKDGFVFKVPVVDASFSLYSLLGFGFYGFSFLLFTILISRHDLTFLNPFSIGVTSILIFSSAVIFFGESLTFAKVLGLSLILIGVLVINVFK